VAGKNIAQRNIHRVIFQRFMPTPLSRTKIASDRELPRPSIKRNKCAKRKRRGDCLTRFRQKL
jgi:hypothetical protein